MGQRASGRVVVMVKIGCLIAVTLAAAAGCAGQPRNPAFTPIEVKIPVATPVYCELAKLTKPELPIADLKPDSAAADTLRAYAATVAILKGAVRERDAVIAGCAAPMGSVRGASRGIPATEMPTPSE